MYEFCKVICKKFFGRFPKKTGYFQELDPLRPGDFCKKTARLLAGGLRSDSQLSLQFPEQRLLQLIAVLQAEPEEGQPRRAQQSHSPPGQRQGGASHRAGHQQ